MVGRRLDLGDPVDVDRGVLLDRGERVRGDEAALRLGAGDRDLDAEHLLEAGPVGPDGAHLGQRVAADHEAVPAGGCDRPPTDPPPADQPMSWRRCIPGQPITSGGVLRDLARRREVLAPPDDRQDAAAGRLPARAAVDGPRRRVEDDRAAVGCLVEPLDPLRARRRIRVAGAREDDPDRRAAERRDAAAPDVGQRPARRREQQRPQRAWRAAASGPGPRGRRGGRCTRAAAARRRSGSGPRRGTRRTACRAGGAPRGSAGGRGRGSARRRTRRGRAAACRRPCRRCSGRGRRRTAACGRGPAAARRARRSRRDSAIRLASGPWSRSSTTTRAEPAAKSRSIAATASSALDATTTPLPAARPSALTTTLAAAAGGLVAGVRLGRAGVVERRRAGHRDARSLRDLVAERLRALDPRGGGRGPEHEDPGVGERVRDAGSQRRLRTDDDELDRALAGDLDDRPRIERVHACETDPRLAPDRVGPRRDDDLVHARLRGELPGERVLAAAATNDEDPRRHDGDGHR